MHILLYGPTIVRGDGSALGALAIEGERIGEIFYPDTDCMVEFSGRKVSFRSLPEIFSSTYGEDSSVIDLTGKHLFAGAIDGHVHFREPGMEHKADMASESLAAAAGGVTSFIDMPNTNPATVTTESLEMKLELASGRCAANYGFHIGATNNNLDIIRNAVMDIPEKFAGIKVFMGSSTGNMLVDEPTALSGLFSIREKPVLVHAEDETTIRNNLADAVSRYGDEIPFSMHPVIRSRKACIISSARALEYAMKYNTRLHLLHISTMEEIEMVRAAKNSNPYITAETSANYLWFCDNGYDRLGSRLKCNPAIKTSDDREALRKALGADGIDTIGSDHAPHLAAEKEGKYRSVPSGMPSVQQSMEAVLTIAMEEGIPLERVASTMSEKPADIFRIRERGYLKKGYYADLVVVDIDSPHTVSSCDILYKCSWSPYEGEKFRCRIERVFVNGAQVMEKGRTVPGTVPGKQLIFE